MVAVAQPHLIIRDGRQWWNCRVCDRKLAEVRGERVIIRRGNFHLEAAGGALCAICEKCGEVNTLACDRLAS